MDEQDRTATGYDPHASIDKWMHVWDELRDFEADGPLPLSSTFDHGFELSAGKFVVPKKLVLYARGSKVFVQFANPYENGGGFKSPTPTET